MTLQLLILFLKQDYGVGFKAKERNEFVVDRCRHFHFPSSTAGGDPAPFLFRKETGMQKRGEYTRKTGRSVCYLRVLQQRKHEWKKTKSAVFEHKVENARVDLLKRWKERHKIQVQKWWLN